MPDGPSPHETSGHGEPSFRSAEEWLADRGVTREPIRVTAPAPPAPGQAPTAGAPAAQPPAVEDEAPPRVDLDDEVRRAINFIRRSTAAQPAAEDRLRAKLVDREVPRAAIDLAMQQARRERLVDDTALAHALVEERRRKGHAAARMRTDLRRRGLPDEVVEQALAATDREDPEAVAFGVARDKAPAYAHLDPETAFRRLVGYLARRGHAEGLARKVAREVVYVEREQQQIAGR